MSIDERRHTCHSFGNYRDSHLVRPRPSRETKRVCASRRASKYDMSFSASDAIFSSPTDPTSLVTSPSTSSHTHTTLTSTNVAKDTPETYNVSRRTPPLTTGPSTPRSTPISLKLSGNHTFNSLSLDASSNRAHLASETSGHFLGPMQPAEFLEAFLPQPLSQYAPKPSFNKSIFDNVPVPRAQKAMYDVLVCLYQTYR